MGHNEVILSGDSYEKQYEVYEHEKCLDDSVSYMLSFFDDWGDGLGSGAYYKVQIDGNTVKHVEGFHFDSHDTIICADHDVCNDGNNDCSLHTCNTTIKQC